MVTWVSHLPGLHVKFTVNLDCAPPVGGSVDFGNKTNHGNGANLNRRDFGLCQGNNNIVFCCGPPPSYQVFLLLLGKTIHLLTTMIRWEVSTSTSI